MSLRTREDYARGIIDQENSYHANWEQQAAGYDQRDVYGKIAEAVELPKKGTHLEVGVGAGHLMHVLNRRAPKATLIGVDRNVAILRGAQTGFPGRKDIHLKGRTTVTFREGFLYREFHPIEKPQLQRGKGQILLILDDIRRANVLQSILGQTPVLDSGTFCFPGRDETAIFEFPYGSNKEISESERARRIQDISNAVRRKVFEIFTRSIKPGGRMVMTDRYLSNLDPSEATLDPIEMLTNDTRTRERLRDAWEIQQASHYFRDPLAGDNGVTDTHIDHSLTHLMGGDGDDTEREIAKKALASGELKRWIGIHTLIRKAA